MLDFFTENLGTIAVALLLAVAVAAIITRLVRDARQGKCPGCGGDCGGLKMRE